MFNIVSETNRGKWFEEKRRVSASDTSPWEDFDRDSSMPRHRPIDAERELLKVRAWSVDTRFAAEDAPPHVRMPVAVCADCWYTFWPVPSARTDMLEVRGLVRGNFDERSGFSVGVTGRVLP